MVSKSDWGHYGVNDTVSSERKNNSVAITAYLAEFNNGAWQSE